MIDLYETRRNEAQATSPYPAQIVTALLSIIARCAIVLQARQMINTVSVLNTNFILVIVLSFAFQSH